MSAEIDRLADKVEGLDYRLDAKMDIMSEKLNDINAELAKISTTLNAQHESLDYHIKRTNLLEEKQNSTEKFVYQCIGVGKLIAIGSALSAMVMAAFKLLGK